MIKVERRKTVQWTDDTKTDTQDNMQSGMLNFGKEEELQ